MANISRLRRTYSNVPAALWKRAVAYIIDILIINLIIIYPFRNLLNLGEDAKFTEVYSHLAASPPLMYNILFVFLSIIILTILYWAVFEYKFSQTVGKMIMRISVISIGGGKLSFNSAVVRNLSKISTFLLGLEVIFMLYKKTNQRYLETVSRTEVIEGESL